MKLWRKLKLIFFIVNFALMWWFVGIFSSLHSIYFVFQRLGIDPIMQITERTAETYFAFYWLFFIGYMIYRFVKRRKKQD